ncbi:MAG: hypothetical protein GY928_22200 [Colwellia sp.]|nr:hypothetical protein [Colwellia sp.]
MKKIYLEKVNPKMKNGRIVLKPITPANKRFRDDQIQLLINSNTLQEFASPEPNKAFMGLLEGVVCNFFNRNVEYISDMNNSYDEAEFRLTESTTNVICKYLNHFTAGEYVIKKEVIEDVKPENGYKFDPTSNGRFKV